ncbi:hypothetical protein FOL47_003021 [Perkinsus chesapeaki]|uniref:Uncharacterized protein n=1 Tax=Perkinsus chesapeaki TaxID=330153 RepID=A0A7J6MA82_PERCH|nr:hypothetical protein FOL47_003021 [Perkinsus chesapeaki]
MNIIRLTSIALVTLPVIFASKKRRTRSTRSFNCKYSKCTDDAVFIDSEDSDDDALSKWVHVCPLSPTGLDSSGSSLSSEFGGERCVSVDLECNGQTNGRECRSDNYYVTLTVAPSPARLCSDDGIVSPKLPGHRNKQSGRIDIYPSEDDEKMQTFLRGLAGALGTDKVELQNIHLEADANNRLSFYIVDDFI